MALLYFGPEVMMPLASAAAAAAGGLLMFGRRLMASARAVFRRLKPSGNASPKPSQGAGPRRERLPRAGEIPGGHRPSERPGEARGRRRARRNP